MTIALLADVHGNLEALEAVLRDLDRRAEGAHLVCAGDVVGYGPDPEACLDRLLARGATLVRGNHEEMVLGWRDDRRCVATGILAVAWTRERLSTGAIRALASLPATATVEGTLLVCHGDPDDAGTYVGDRDRALSALARARERGARILVCGHTHHPMCFSRRAGAAIGGGSIELDRSDQVLINPGAVGQARDGVPRAAYALLDLERDRLELVSVEYDHRTTIAKARAAGLTPSVTLSAPRGRRASIERMKARAARTLVRIPPLRRALERARRTQL